MHTEKIQCPACGKKEGVPLVWGDPDEATWKASRRGEIVLAGCAIEPIGDAVPDYACLDCSHRWREDVRY